MVQIDTDIARIIQKEPPFWLFKTEGILCCVLRNMHFGTWNGYASVTPGHKFYGKGYREKVHVPNIEDVPFNGNFIGALCADPNEVETGIISLDMLINVHYGLTYSGDHLWGIEEEVFGKCGGLGLTPVIQEIINPLKVKYPYGSPLAIMCTEILNL